MKPKLSFLLITLQLGCLAFLPGAQAAPKKAPAAPETALSGFNTADGDHALFSLTTGVANSGFGWYSLFSNTEGSYNTAVGAACYQAVNAMLLNEFLKEHKKVETQETTIGQLQSNAAKAETTISELRKDIGVLTVQLKERTMELQKVSEQLERSRPAPRIVKND